MSHSNQCECGKCQTKADTERDEARHASVTFFQGAQHSCLFDDLPATALLNGVYLCQSHAICNTCLTPLTEDGLTCRCDQYGYVGHEELLYCSLECMEAKHPSEPEINGLSVSEGEKERL